MSSNLAVSVSIGAALAGSFRQVLGGADKQFSKLGQTVGRMDRQMGALRGFQANQRALQEAETGYRSARERVAQLTAAMRQTRQPSQQMRQELAAAHREADRARQAFESKRATLAESRREVRALGLSYRDIEGQQRRLASATQNLSHRQQQLGSAMARAQQIKQNRAALRGQIMDTVALGMALVAPIRAASNLESAEVRLRTVISADDTETAMAEARRHALEWGRRNPTNAADMLGISYALSSAGFDADAARFGSEIVAKVATATDGQVEQVGELIGVVYNNLGKAMEGEMEDKIARIGDVLVQTQNAFQLRDFGQLAESMKEGASAAIRYNVPLEQTAAVLGQFNSAGLMGGRAGTAMNAVLRQMGKASEDFGFTIERSADGSMDLMATLDNLRESLDIFDDPDEKARALQEAFGDQGGQVVLLLENMEALNKQYETLRDNADGATDRSYETRIASTANQMQILRNRVTEAGIALGSALLPGVNALGGVIGTAATALAKFAERFPTLTKWVVGLTAGLIAGKVAAVGLAYAWTFVQGAGAAVVVGIRSVQAAVALATVRFHTLNAATLVTQARMRAMAAGGAIKAVGASLMGLAGRAIPAVITGIRAMGVAMMTNPIGIAVAAIAAGALLVRKYWEPISAFFGGLWGGIKSGLEPVITAFKGFASSTAAALSPLLSVFHPLGAMIGWVADQVGALVGWFGGLLSPVDASSESLSRAAGVGETVGHVIGTLLGGAVRLAALPFRVLGAVVSTTVGLLTGAVGVFKKVFDWSPLGLLIRGFGAVTDWLSGIDWSESGRAILGTLVDGIKSVAMAPVNAVRNTLGKVRELLPFSDAKTGPLSDLTASGASIPSTLAEGAQSAQEVLGQSLRGVLSSVWSGARELLSGNVDVGAKIGEVLTPARQAASAGLVAASAVMAPATAAADAPQAPAKVEISNHYQISVQAAPGMDAEEVATLVQRKIEEAEEAKARQRRGQLYDGMN